MLTTLSPTINLPAIIALPVTDRLFLMWVSALVLTFPISIGAFKRDVMIFVLIVVELKETPLPNFIVLPKANSTSLSK